MAITVLDNEPEHRYEVHVDGELGGFTVFGRRPGLIAFIHTEIDPKFEGQGLGSTLIHEALEAARSDGLAVLPFCPFVSHYIREHGEYLDLVPPDRREAFDL